ncbi:MAG: hypothetical protein GC146_14745 [Limimaricola sp.]|uniref:Hint domain-containing protein n=1 Tax=Limimaricola sp. TaxID=2211665 RepID=UPI001D1E9271|nr:Hint domain-containing protein [Limimaricola sp.]MBI1418473.1 hypothetical protein [Limimaricola sp.]
MTTAAAETEKQDLNVLPAESFRVTEGVAQGDPLGFADELEPDDIYQVAPGTTPQRLVIETTAQGGVFRVAGPSPTGTPGHTVHLDSCLTLMDPSGFTFEALVLVEVEDDAAAAIYMLPLGQIAPDTDYRLVGIDRHAATARFAEAAMVSFGRGTRIALASGLQVPVEALKVGDKVLTRDDGARPIRWIGSTTLRAVGSFAPVLIRAGALHNSADLVVSPEQRLFVYQRHDDLGAGRPEVLVKARHLVNGTSVVRQEGGFVDYFQILMDEHQIIFAEGIATESLLIDPRTRAALPDEAGRAMGPGGRHARRKHHEYEVQESLLSQRDAAALLRRASGR